jgi:hypothetical protein
VQEGSSHVCEPSLPEERHDWDAAEESPDDFGETIDIARTTPC